jgi:hypothetical protein
MILFISGSCRDKSYDGAIKIYHKDFGEAINLNAEEIEFDEPLMKPTKLLLIDSILLVYNSNTEMLICRYNVNTLKKTGEGVYWGGGPEDLLGINNMQSSDSSVWLIDAQKRMCFNYKLSNICFENTFSPVNKITMTDHFSFAWIFPDNRVIAISRNPDGKRLSFFSPDGKIINSKGDYPSFNEELTDFEKIEGFHSQIAVNYSANRVYLSCLAVDLIEIFDLNGELIKRVHGPDHFFPAVEEKHSGNQLRVVSKIGTSRDTYSSPVVVNDELYILYSGNYFTFESRNWLKDQLFVYDKDGNPLRRYKLSEKIQNIVVDAEKKIIYGISEDPEYHLLKFCY